MSRKLYGEQAKRTLARRNRKATEEFARKLIKNAEELKGGLPLQALLLTKAYEIGLRGGCCSAAEDGVLKRVVDLAGKSVAELSEQVA